MADTETGISQWWRLAHTVNVVDATLLALGHEPHRIFGDVEEPPETNQPDGYLALRTAILNGISRGELPGQIIEWDGSILFDYPSDMASCDPARSYVEIAPLFTWLESHGFRTGLLFSNDAKLPGVRDASHPRYSSKLGAAIAAWEAFDEIPAGPGTAKQKLEIWLRQHAVEFGLVDKKGKPRESVIKQIATVANWATTGGRPQKMKV
jgi:hypothetical protein